METNYKNNWLEIGRANSWICDANDPVFNEQSFQECTSDEELLAKFEQGIWCLGQAFHIGDLCFIQQVDGGDEWLTIKGDLAFESFSFGSIIKSDGKAAQAMLDRIRQATPEQCRSLNY